MAKVNLKISKELWLLGLILVVGAFLRLYKIDQYMTFLGDEGRDVIIVSRFIKHFDLMLVGPGTSVGNMYLGPLYYYLMVPALFLAGFSPVGRQFRLLFWEWPPLLLFGGWEGSGGGKRRVWLPRRFTL